MTKVPVAGEVFEVIYPFVRDVYHGLDEDGYSDIPTWKPGIGYRDLGPEDSEAYCNAEGLVRFSVVDVYKPGRFPTRVFFTRRYVSPTGHEFGKGRLRIWTLEKFRRLTRGFQVPYTVDADEDGQ